MRDLPEAFTPFAREPSSSGLFVDFDGTLADIVDDPDAARPVDGAVEALEALARRMGRVGVVSGRPLAFLRRFLDGPDLYLAGLYGMQWLDGGRVGDHPQAGIWRQVVEDVVSAGATGPEGMRVESKDLSLTLHYREHPEAAAAVRRWAEEQAARSGLEARPARMSMELHPPIEADKGTAVLAAATGLARVAFAGDDLGDLEAYDALDALDAEGVATVRVAVGSAEAPPELLERADVVLDGPAEVVELLRRLAD